MSFSSGQMKKIRFRKFKLLATLIVALIILGATFAYGKSKIGAPKDNETASQPSGVIPVATADEPPQEASAPQAISDMPILMYHHIRAYNDQSDKIGYNLSVDPAKFASQLDMILSLGYATVSFNDIASSSFPAKPIILTFDDGYDNFYTNAYPALKARNMKAVVYIITNKLNADGYLTESQIADMIQNGIEVGSHTFSHPDLTTVSEEKAATELSESKSRLETLIGQSINSLCYPLGKANDAVESKAKLAGYQYAVTTQSGVATFSNPLALNRYRVNRDTNISSYIK